MAPEIIHSIEDLLEIVQTYAKVTVIYRGVTSSEYQLVPTVGRRRRRGGKAIEAKDERYILRLFQQRGIAHLQRRPDSDWDWLAIAQHHGLPTRLLDWTRNPLAAYFAVVQKHEGDSAIYVYRSKLHLSINKNPDPFKVNRVARFVPDHTTLRITVQSGLFTIHPKPAEPFTDAAIDKFVIPAKERKSIKKTLDKLGINTSSMFPDLDGIARHIDGLRTDEY